MLWILGLRNSGMRRKTFRTCGLEDVDLAIADLQNVGEPGVLPEPLFMLGGFANFVHAHEDDSLASCGQMFEILGNLPLLKLTHPGGEAWLFVGRDVDVARNRDDTGGHG